MKIVTLLLMASALYATSASQISFNTFLEQALEQSRYLKSSSVAIKQAKKEGEILSRYANPSLEVEYSSFQPDVGSAADGFRLNYAQPIRLWSVGSDKKALNEANIQDADARYTQTKAMFIRDLSLLYTQYAQGKKLLILGAQELKIAKKIYDISLARLESGSISEGLTLQAQVDYEMIESVQEQLYLNSNNRYFKLLSFAGITEELELDEAYLFSIKGDVENIQNPNIKLYQAQQNQALREAELNSNSIEWVNLFAELEKEPNQDIYRVGLNIPLAIFNNKSEEKNIAQMKATRSKLLIENEKNRLNMELIRLSKERSSLLALNEKREEILKTQLRLLKMYEEGYKIANTSLLQLQDIKNKTIQTRREIIQTHRALNENVIQTNYIKGNYND